MTHTNDNSVASTPVVWLTIAACALSYLLVNLLGSQGLQGFALRYLSLWPLGSGYTMPWQLLSYGYLHGSLEHFFFNTFAIWMFGSQLERTLGSRRFLVLYIAGLISAAVVQLLVQALTGDAQPTIGASGAIFGLLLTYAVFYPNSRIVFIFPPIPIKAKWFVLIYAIAELLLGLTGAVPTVAHFAHLGGLIGAAIVLWRWGWRPGVNWKAD